MLTGEEYAELRHAFSVKEWISYTASKGRPVLLCRSYRSTSKKCMLIVVADVTEQMKVALFSSTHPAGLPQHRDRKQKSEYRKFGTPWWSSPPGLRHLTGEVRRANVASWKASPLSNSDRELNPTWRREGNVVMTWLWRFYNTETASEEIRLSSSYSSKPLSI